MKKFLSIFLVVFIIFLGATGCISSRAPHFSTKVPTVFDCVTTKYVVDDYTEIEELFITELSDKGLCSYQLYDASELTAEILENRSGVTIIERCVGMVVDKTKGDGVILNAYDPKYNYISYRSCEQEVYDGTILVSYMIYNPNTTYVDDIVERHDFVICKDYEHEVAPI